MEGRYPPRLNADGTQILYQSGFNAEDPAQPVNVMENPLEGGSPPLQRPSNILKSQQGAVIEHHQ